VLSSDFVQRLAVVALVTLSACVPRSKWAAVDLYGPPVVPPGAYEHYLRGRLASVEGRHEEAVAEFRLAASMAPDQAEPRIAIAEELLREGRRDAARDEVAEVLRRWPREPEAWLASGRIRVWASELREAVADFEKAIELAPRSETGYLLAAAGYKQLGERAKAEALYRRLVRKVPDSVEGHYRLGQMLVLKRRFDDAEQHLAEAVALDPDYTEARVLLADVFRQTNRPQLASQMLRDAFDRSGEDAEVGQKLVDVLLEAGDRDGALELLATLDADWRSARTRVDIGYIYLRVRRPEAAIKTADDVLARDPTYESARVLKARGLGLAKRRGDAVKVALEVPADSSEHAEARAYAAEILGKEGKLAEAIKLVDDALKEHPANATLLVQQAQLLEKKGDVGKARALLDQALLRDPTTRRCASPAPRSKIGSAIPSGPSRSCGRST
jgi:tetratricopeptide (TPR) repeat protein